MLVLGRKVNETLVLHTQSGERIVVMVCDIDGRDVRVGVDAPKSVVVMRGEIEHRTRKED